MRLVIDIVSWTPFQISFTETNFQCAEREFNHLIDILLFGLCFFHANWIILTLDILHTKFELENFNYFKLSVRGVQER